MVKNDRKHRASATGLSGGLVRPQSLHRGNAAIR